MTRRIEAESLVSGRLDNSKPGRVEGKLEFIDCSVWFDLTGDMDGKLRGATLQLRGQPNGDYLSSARELHPDQSGTIGGIYLDEDERALCFWWTSEADGVVEIEIPATWVQKEDPHSKPLTIELDRDLRSQFERRVPNGTRLNDAVVKLIQDYCSASHGSGEEMDGEFGKRWIADFKQHSGDERSMAILINKLWQEGFDDGVNAARENPGLLKGDCSRF